MAEIERPTFEQAKICPKCNNPGEDRVQRPVPGMPRGTLVHMVYCVQEGCEWYDSCWMVQTNPDGTVPPPRDHRGEAKVYVGFEGHDQQARDIRAAIEADKILQQKVHHEIKKPRDL